MARDHDGGPASVDASATTVPAASSDRQEDARRAFNQGVALFRDKNFEAALIQFQASYESSPEPIVLYNIAKTNRKLFRYSDSIAAYLRYLDESRKRGEHIGEERRTEVETAIAEIEKLLTQIWVKIAPASAALKVNGQLVTLPATGVLRLAAGTHKLEVTAEGYQSQQRELVVVAGKREEVEIALKEIPRTGRVRILASELGAEVFLDGHRAGLPPVDLDIAAGKHLIEVRAPGFLAWRKDLEVVEGQSTQFPVELDKIPQAATEPEKTSLHQRWWFWAGLGLGAVVAGVMLWTTRPSHEEPIFGSWGSAKAD